MVEVSFTDRLGLISSIVAAYKTAYPDLASAEATSTARSLESNALAEAESIDAYRDRCNTILADLKSVSKNTNDSASTPTVKSVATKVLETRKSAAKYGKWQQLAYFDRGIFSQVFVAEAPEHLTYPGGNGLVEFVALKVIDLNAIKDPHDARKEIRILKKFHHPGIIPLLDSFNDGIGHSVIVLPFLPFSLAQHLQKKTPFDKHLKTCLKDLFQALEYIHSFGIIHRDIKPDNVLLHSPRGPAFVSDFGISWDPNDGASEPPYNKISDAGSTCYRPPELLFGSSSYDTSLDMWAAGCIVAEIVRADGTNLFEHGDAGTDLTLIMGIIDALGTPTTQIWPELAAIPDYTKLDYLQKPAKKWQDILPDTAPDVQDLVGKLIRYSGGRRLKADKVLNHPFFN